MRKRELQARDNRDLDAKANDALIHREQAKVLAGLSLSTNDATKVHRLTRAAMGHLERAQALEGVTQVRLIRLSLPPTNM
jgi:hypothetical protein